MNLSALKRPGGCIPLAMSLAAFSVVVGHIAVFGVTHEADNDCAAKGAYEE